MVSRQLSRVFEVENVDYQRLEVGSPGVDRPLRQEQDFLRFANERIEIRLRQPVNNRKVFSGILRTDDNAGSSSSVSFRLELEPQSKKGPAEELSFTLDDIDRAKLDPVLDFKGKKR
jgi:ribosome maturation factor RimP